MVIRSILRHRNSSKTRHRALPGALCVLIVLAAGTLGAQSVPTGIQEYFILGWEQHIWDMMDEVQNSQGGGQFVDGMNSVVTATAAADNQVIYYDHWEDGPDSGLANFPASIGPLQGSTLVIGDLDASNGEACQFNTNLACGNANDVLRTGDYVNFNSDQGLGGGCASLPAEPEKCSVPLNPRCAAPICTSAEIRFDGGDLMNTSGGPLALIHGQYPLTNFIGGSTEILSRQAVEAARSYSVPIGEDLYAAGTVTEPFHFVHLDLVAFEDTEITVESPGAGTVSFSLSRGRHWSSMGFIDDSPQPALALLINSGSKVSTTAPIAGMIFTGGDGTWATRHYALLPDILHSTDYVTTAPGDDPNAGPTTNGTPQDRPANVYILNPDQFTAIDVDITDSSGNYTVTIQPNSMESMQDLVPGRDIAANSTVRMTSDRNFWGVTAYDYGTNISDWGHSWLAMKFLTPTYTVSFAPGNQNQPPDGSQYANPVFVAATADRTRVQFDLQNDGVFDLVDLDGDGAADAAPYPDNTYEVNMLSALRVIDPNDNDMTGARILANKPIAVSWGQDTDRSFFSDNALDTGFTVYPVNQLFLDPALVIDKVTDIGVVPVNPADPDERIVTYTLTVKSFDFGPLTNAQVFDLLPTGVAGADYIPGSTLITYPNLVQDTVEPVASVEPSGRHRLDWPLTSDPPWDPGDPPFSFATDNTLTVSYQVRIPPAPGGTPRVLINEGHADAQLGGSLFSPFDAARVVQTDVELTKAVDTTNPAPGDVVTFTINVLNNGLTDETGVFISDAIPPDTTYCDSSTLPLGTCSDPTGAAPFTAGTFNSAQNAVIWTAATLLSGQSATLSFQVKVNPTTPAGTRIPNRAGYDSNETPYFLSNEVEPVVEGATLTAVKSIVGNPAFVHPYEVVTFDVIIANSGSATATSLLIIDPFPLNATYVAGSMQWSLNSGAFVPLTDADDGDEGGGAEGILNASNLEFRLASLGVAEDVTLRFRTVVNAGTSGQFVFNQATFASDETLSTDTNAVQVPIVGNATINGHVFLDVNGNGVQDGGEPDIPNVDVEVSSVSRQDYSCNPGTAIPDGGYDGTQGSMVCCAITVPAGDFGATPSILDLDLEMGINHTWVGDLTAKVFGPGGQVLAVLNRPGSNAPDDGTDLPYGYGTNWTGAGVTFDDDGGGPSAETLGLVGTDICSGDGICSYLPAPDTAAGLANLAGFDGTTPVGAWSVCVGDSVVVDVGIFASATLSFVTNESPSTTQIVTTDANGDYAAVVVGTTATLDVDESDPDFPTAAVLTTANDPQTITTVPGGTVIAPDVGYQQPELVFNKTSDPVDHEVSPGQTITYTLEITNNTGVTQTGIDIDDPLPTGTSYVAGSTQVSGSGASALRVTEYFLGAATFAGATYDLTLDQDLEANYFVIVQGSAGTATANDNRGPDANYAALVQDPFGTGQLGTTPATDEIRLERGAATDSWVGVVTVVECLTECDTTGFVLRDVRLVDHAGTDTIGADTAGGAWTDINQVMLMGGFNGAGCLSSEANSTNTKVCHARIFPSGSDQINWTRDAGGATLSTATSTVMAVEWGSSWTVQRVRVQGNNGGGGADAVGEYNTTAISSVARANTWVWGTGHTNDQGIGDAAEGCLITLGNGVNQNVNESTVAVGLEYNNNNVDFEVYALTHPDLAADHVFKTDGDSGSLTVDVTVASAAAQRMALSYNGQNGTGNAYPRPMFSARYVANDSVRLERRRSGQAFPAWVQGIDFSAIAAQGGPPSGGVPPNLVIPSDGYTVSPGGTLTVTFQVVVDDPPAAGITQIINSATLSTTQQPGPFNASVTDDVVRAGVDVEYDNAGFDLVGATVTYAHEIRNTGDGDDSYDITITSKVGWPVDLIDPGTGAVIASDTDGDGIWDGGVSVNTGTMAAGETVQYQLRITIPSGPGGAAVGDTESTGLIATSGRNPGLWGIATDETIAIDSLDPIIFLPDNSGVATAGGKVVYSHRIINNTGAPETFDLEAARETDPSPWTATYYWDSNGDGVYTDGIDIAITNTAQLANGASQLVFLVIDVPAGATDYTVDVVHLTAFAQSDPTDSTFDTATDTTTVRPPIVLDLSGGGTRNVTGGSTAVFPGTVRNFTDVADVMNFDITEAWFYGFDSFNHPTELWIDSNGDGTPNLEIAEDTDGDGAWDTIAPGYDTDNDNQPDVNVPADSALSYELRRDVDPGQGSSRDPVTLTVFSTNSTDQDSVTATNFLAAATKAVFASFDAYAVNSQVVVEWRTAAEVGTVGFELLRRREGEDRFTPVHNGLIKALAGALQGGTYSVVDLDSEVGQTLTYVIHERDVWGGGTVFGPVTIKIIERKTGLKAAEALAVGQSRVANTSVVRGPRATKAAPAGVPSGLVKVLVREEGLVWLSTEELATAFDTDPQIVAGWIETGNLWIGTYGDDGAMSTAIFDDGFESGNTSRWGGSKSKDQGANGVAWTAASENAGLYFYGQTLDSIYTRDNVYWIGVGAGATMAWRPASAMATGSLDSFVADHHHEEEAWPLTSVITDPEADYWFWDYFFPYSGEPSVSKSFELSAPGAMDNDGTAVLTVHLQGSFEDEVSPNHRVEVRLNGSQLGGTFAFDGHYAYDLELVFPQSLLVDGTNTVEITALLAPGLDFDEFYLDSFDLRYHRSFTAQDDRLLGETGGISTVTVRGFSSDDITVFDLTDPLLPVVLDPVRVDAYEGSFMVSFTTDGTAFPFLATTSASSLYPADLVIDLVSTLSDSSNRGRYVVIAGNGLEAEAALLADYRSQQGLSSVVARTSDIYDEFNGGIKNPWAIRRFLEHASENWAEPPEFVFLAGDGSLDHKGIWGGGEDLIPAPMAVTDDGLVPADNLLADWDGGDGVPEVAIGRLPAQSAGELADFRSKIGIFEASSGSWKRHTLWLADDADIGGEFSDDIEELISAMPPDYTVQRVFLENHEVGAAWQLTLDTMTKGAVLVNFLGHGGFDRLAEEGLIVTDNAALMENGDRTPFMTVLSCIVGRFDVPGYDTLSEALLLNDGGGTIGVWSPSAYSLNADSRELGKYHAMIIAGGEASTIGQSVREALAAYAAAGTGDPALPQKFILLGDPATRVDW